jgi:hypothetical protein
MIAATSPVMKTAVRCLRLVSLPRSFRQSTTSAAGGGQIASVAAHNPRRRPFWRY